MKNKSLSKSQKKQLSHLITEGYGTPQEFAEVLDLNLEMLFYVEEEVFTPREIQGVVGALRGVIRVLRLREKES